MLPLRNRPCNHPQHKTYNLEEIIMKKFIKNTVNSIRGDVVMPTLNKRITEMFNYAG